MAKPMLVTFPFVLLLVDAWPFRRLWRVRTFLEKLPFFALSLASAIVTYMVQRSDGAVRAMPLGVTFRNAFISYLIYIRQAFWPAGLIAYYPYPKFIAVWQAAVALLFLLGVSVLAILSWRRSPYIATGWFWYLGTLVPVIGFVQVGAQSHADRYMYLPLTGLTVIVAWGAADIAAKWPRSRTAIASAGILACLACLGIASAQAAYWRNTETLYGRALAVNQDNFFVQYGLGDYLLQFPDRGAEAVPHFEQALRMNPNSANSYNSIGGYLLQNGREAEAEAQFRAALRVKPDLAAAHFNLGQIYAKDPRRLPAAVAQYQAALQAQPDFPHAERNLGFALLRLGRTSEAITHFAAAQRLAPDPEVTAILDALRSGH
jgi:tetratricopeptide (TPR) repeat protein